MSENERHVPASPAAVFAVLSDGWTYGGWVVGAARIRDVDSDWPSEDSKIHHSVGVWPLLLDDTTSVEECVEPKYLRLKVRAWPTGAGRVEFFIEPDGDGSRVRMHEKAVAGPSRLIPSAVLDPILHRRNDESLRRLSYLVEGHQLSGRRSSNGAPSE